MLKKDVIINTRALHLPGHQKRGYLGFQSTETSQILSNQVFGKPQKLLKFIFNKISLFHLKLFLESLSSLPPFLQLSQGKWTGISKLGLRSICLSLRLSLSLSLSFPTEFSISLSLFLLNSSLLSFCHILSFFLNLWSIAFLLPIFYLSFYLLLLTPLLYYIFLSLSHSLSFKLSHSSHPHPHSPPSNFLSLKWSFQILNPSLS